MKINNGRFKKGQTPWNKDKHPEYLHMNYVQVVIKKMG